MDKFTIGEPTQMPHGGRGEYGKWGPLLDKVREMPNGKVLPLEFEDTAKATVWTSGKAGSFKRRGVRTQRRGNVVYLSKIEDNDNAGG